VAGDQGNTLQHGEVLHHGLPGHRQLCRQHGRGALAGRGERIEHPPSHRIGKRSQHGVDRVDRNLWGSTG